MKDHWYWMDRALEEAALAAQEGEIPVGAVLICGDRLLAADHNRREQNQDPTAHAEILVLRSGAARLGSWRLNECTLYVTLEPCPMCAGAIVQGRVGCLVYGVTDRKTGAVESNMNLVQDPRYNHQVQVLGGIREDACRKILEDWFRRNRTEK